MKDAPMTPKTPTVFTSPLSIFGPLTLSNVRTVTSGQTPVAREYAPCP
jgi:hypothetical protein